MRSRGRIFLLLALLLLPQAAGAVDPAGWGRVRWGMTSAQVAALYRGQALRLDGPIEFYGLYSDVVLRDADFAGLAFTVYFQMSDATHLLAQVLLERQRQYATPAAWQATVAALTAQFGPPTLQCRQAAQPYEGKPLLVERAWVMPTTTVRATFLDFGPYVPTTVWRRLLVRYAPTRPGPAACPG